MRGAPLWAPVVQTESRSSPPERPAVWSTHMRARLGSLVFATICLAACGHHPPPYPRGSQPTAAEVLAATAPRVPAMTVAEAEIVLNRTVRGDLALLAQQPARFRGSVSKGGNELVTLAFHEDGYALRYKLGELPNGFYTGPPSTCAVQAMLGVPLSTESLVALVLGGGPLLSGPHRVVAQKWDRKGGYESLVLANDAYEQELRFVLRNGQWVVQGAAMWRREGGRRGAWMWEFEHDRFERNGSFELPTRTRIRAPGRRRDNTIVIHYRERDLEPGWARAATPSTPTSEAPTTTGSTPAPDDGGWDNEGGWENDEGWENAEPSEEAAPEAPPEPPPSEPKPTQPDPIPEVFRLAPTGLVQRGDLCTALRSVSSGASPVAGP